MPTYKDFVKKIVGSKAVKSVFDYPSPDTVVHGSHAKPYKKFKSVFNYPSPDSVVHGTHANKPGNVKEQTEEDKYLGAEPFERFKYDFMLHDFNKHLATDEHKNYDPKDQEWDDYFGELASNFKFRDYQSNITTNLDNRHPLERIDTDLIKHARGYTVSSSDLNKHLLDSHKRGDEPLLDRSFNGASIGKLDELVNGHMLPKMELFTGTSFDPSIIGKDVDDHYIVHMPAFTSSSHNQEVARSFAKPDYGSPNWNKEAHMMRIHIPQGHPGFHIGNNYEKTEVSGEFETLLPRGMTLKIGKKPTTFDTQKPGVKSDYGVKYLQVWDAHPVPPGEDPETWQPPETPKMVPDEPGFRPPPKAPTEPKPKQSSDDDDWIPY